MLPTVLEIESKAYWACIFRMSDSCALRDITKCWCWTEHLSSLCPFITDTQQSDTIAPLREARRHESLGHRQKMSLEQNWSQSHSSDLPELPETLNVPCVRIMAY